MVRLWVSVVWRESPQTIFRATNPDAPLPLDRLTTYPFAPRRNVLISLRTQTECLVILELVQCGHQCVCNRVTDVFGCLRLCGHPLTERILCDIVSKTFTKCVEFANLTLVQS